MPWRNMKQTATYIQICDEIQLNKKGSKCQGEIWSNATYIKTLDVIKFIQCLFHIITCILKDQNAWEWMILTVGYIQTYLEIHFKIRWELSPIAA
jgi:hypothetical protein